jgi:hypothetical protein
MKYLILAVLLAVLQTPPPVPRKTTDSAANTSQKIPPKTSNNQTPTAPPRPPVNTNAAPNHDAARNEQGTDNAQNPVIVGKLPTVSIKKDWSDWGIWGFSALLVVVGALQVWVLIRQANIMGKHAEHLKNLTAAANDSARAAKEGADAANKNIEMFISKERARLVVDLQKLKLTPRAFDVYTVDFTVSIHGATSAYVTETGCAAYFGSLEAICAPETGNSSVSSLPLLPKVISPNTPPSEQFAIWRFGKESAEDIISDIKNGKLFIGIRGSIKYKDVFDQERETRFRYVWKYLFLEGLYGLGGDAGDWQPCGSPDENKNT